MPDTEELVPFLKKLLTTSSEEAPTAESALAKAPKSPEVVGEGASKAVPSEPEVKDAEVVSQQAPVGPDQAQLEDKSSDSTPSLSDRWAKLKSLAPYAGAAGAGVAADVAMEGGNKTTQQASTPVVPPNSKAAPATSDDDDEKLLSDLQNQYEPDNKIASKAAVAPKSANASDDDDSSDDKSTPSTPYTNSASAFSNQRLAELQDRANKLQALNSLARGMTAAVATAGQQRNQFDPTFEAQGKEIAARPEQYLQQAAAQKMDPNSPASIAARNLASYIDPDMKINPNMSAADLEKVNPQLANISTSEDAQDIKKAIADERLANQRNTAVMLQAKLQDVKDQKQLNTYNQTVQQLESTRTSSPAVQQAEKDVYSAQKIRSLVNTIGGGDPSKLSPQNLHLLISEVNKMASGGQGTDMGLQHLTPDTFQGELASSWQKFVNHPVPANAGEFAKQYINYANDIGERGKQVIKDRYGRIINSRASQFSPDQLANLNQYYINRFDEPDDKVTKIAKEQAAKVVQDDNKAKSDVATSTPPQPSAAPSLQDAAAAEKARRKALKAQQGNQ